MSMRYDDRPSRENHQRAAELHELAAHAHRIAAEENGTPDQPTGQERSRQSLEHSRQAYLQTQQMYRRVANRAGNELFPTTSPERAGGLKGLAIHASDGEIGSIEEFYFDDETWTIRYMVVKTGSLFSGRKVLISPMFLRRGVWDGKQLHLALTKKQIENSPDIDTQKPVSRQHEAQYMDYYGAPNYWIGPWLWGASPFPGDFAGVAIPIEARMGEVSPQEVGDSHLRSTAAVKDYHVEAADGEIGHVADFIVDMDSWRIRYLEVKTRNWMPGKTVLIPAEWIETVSWAESKVHTSLPLEAIRNAPEYAESEAISPDYENLLLEHYNQPAGWTAGSGRDRVH